MASLSSAWSRFLQFFNQESKTRDDTYVIVGAGVFGSSVALHLIRKYPKAKVTLIDRTPFPSKVGASWDWNKIIRADYTNILYMELAIEAMNWWRSDPLFSPFYHESGALWVDSKGVPQTILANFKKLSAKDKCRLINNDEAKQLWGGIHADADYTNVTDILLNESSGWADAAAALTKVIETAVAAGVNYVVGDIEKVLFDDEGSSTGVLTAKGDVHSAAHIILATGAMTAKILADSAPQRKEMQVDGRLVAAAVCTGMVTLDDEDAACFRKGPVFVHTGSDIVGGSTPPNAQNQLKFYRNVSFTNTVYHEASNQNISVPPNQADYAMWDLTPAMKRELGLVSKGIYGNKCSDWKYENYRICWDSITPTQDQIICEHPHSKNLFFATGGSFHSWKFLPIIGKYVIQMMEGTLDPKLVKTWAWDREDKGSAHEGLIPTREMRDVV